MSKLSFRARALDASKPMPIFMAEELPDLPDYSAINRAVPQMPSGMEKEEECEHHLQRAICAGLIIPTPEVSDIPQKEFFEKVYPSNYKQPRQLIHMQPFTMEQDIPDYDMDSEDERWLQSQTQRLELDPLKFEEMMDRLEKSSGQTVVTINEAKALLKEDDDLITTVFDYWLNKRLKTQHPLNLSVKTEHRAGIAANNPYLAFRRRTDKMQTRKNRKNDEVSYEKMLKLKRDFCRAVTLLELVKKREKMKRELVHLTVEVFEKRYNAKDFNGAIVNEMAMIKPTATSATRPAFTPIFHNHYANQGWSTKALLKDDGSQRKEKRQYKKRKHKSYAGHHQRVTLDGLNSSSVAGGAFSSDEDGTNATNIAHLNNSMSPEPEANEEDEGLFAFRRNKNCSYHMPHPQLGNWPWCSKDENGGADKRFRYSLTSISDLRNRGGRRCVGFARRRIGRGGRMILDRASQVGDDEFWRTLDFTITEPVETTETSVEHEETVAPSTNCGVVGVGDGDNQEEILEYLRSIRRDWLHFRPKTPPPIANEGAEIENFDSYYKLGSLSPFSLEIQNLDGANSLLFEENCANSFISDAFTFENVGTSENTPKSAPSSLVESKPDGVEIKSTVMQQQVDNVAPSSVVRTTLLNVNVGINTLNNTMTTTNNLSTLSNKDNNEVERFESVDENIVNNNKKLWCCDGKTSGGDGGGGSSKFRVWEHLIDGDAVRIDKIEQKACNKTNGILPPYKFEQSPILAPSPGDAIVNAAVKRKNHASGYDYNNDVLETATSGISLHTSAHTLTLNSHSANIFEITADGNNVTNEIPCTESGGTKSAATSSNKSKTIVRKNNFVMEVT